jgi:hypothetical protein
MHCRKKGDKFFRDFQKEFLAEGFYPSIEASEKPTSRQTSICGRRRARPTTPDNRQPRTDNETRSRLKARWAHRLKAYVPWKGAKTG